MIDFFTGLKIITSQAQPGGKEPIALDKAYGRVLAKDVHSRWKGPILNAGCRLGAGDIALVAEAGMYQIVVAQKVNVGIISVGEGWIEPSGWMCKPSQAPDEGQRYNSSAAVMLSSLNAMGGSAKYIGIAQDGLALKSMLQDALKTSQIVLLSGASLPNPVVDPVLKQLGLHIQFDGLNTHPGGECFFASGSFPIEAAGPYFGEADEQRYMQKYVFGLPGDPFADFIACRILVKHLICAIQCCTQADTIVDIPLAQTFTRTNEAYLAHLPMRLLSNGTGFIPDRTNPLIALSGADAIARIPAGFSCIQAGDTVSAILL